MKKKSKLSNVFGIAAATQSFKIFGKKVIKNKLRAARQQKEKTKQLL